jgi:hypothetical protein
MLFGWGSGPPGCFVGYFSFLGGRFLCLKVAGLLIAISARMCLVCVVCGVLVLYIFTLLYDEITCGFPA